MNTHVRDILNVVSTPDGTYLVTINMRVFKGKGGKDYPVTIEGTIDKPEIHVEIPGGNPWIVCNPLYYLERILKKNIWFESS